MKKSIIYSSAIAAALCLTGCLDEFTPTNQATADQIKGEDKSALSSAVSAYMTTYSSYSNGGTAGDAGFPAFGITRDAMTADTPVSDPTYDYFTEFSYLSFLGNYAGPSLWWRRYYYLVQKCNIVLSVSEPDDREEDKEYAGNALAYRAMAYFDLARMYEYRHTDVASLDQQAQSLGIMGLTVPIVTEDTSDSDGRDNPRVPFYVMYRFIAEDLDNAERYLADFHTVSSKVNASLGVVYGLKARFWLELGTRFQLYPGDLDTMLGHENDGDIAYGKLGISSAAECFNNAALYARRAISEGYTPLTESQWFDPKTGFNSPNASWLWCVTLTLDNPAVNLEWQSFVSYVSPEATWGVCDRGYGASRMIDASLFDKIPDADWRKTTWIDPADEGDEQAYNTKYAKGTSMGYSEWSKYGSYVGFKYHPGSGDRTTYTVGNAVSVPLMRIEEMYLIEAEAVARVSGVGAGKQLLESFLNTYRYHNNAYTCNAAGIEEFIDEIFTQKRIELWLEGLIVWDYRRLEKPVIRGYEGTNWYSEYRFNSYPNAVAPWMTLYIPDSEKNYNKGVILNPNPSNAVPLWTGGN